MVKKRLGSFRDEDIPFPTRTRKEQFTKQAAGQGGRFRENRPSSNLVNRLRKDTKKVLILSRGISFLYRMRVFPQALNL